MKPTAFVAALLVASFSTTAVLAADDAPAIVKPAKKKAPKKTAEAKDGEKVTPRTEAAAPKMPEAAPVPLETLPPPAAITVEPSAPPAPAAPAVNADRTPAPAPNTESSTRIEVIAGRTQGLGFGVGFRAGHRMASSVYLGGAAMLQTSVAGGVVAYPAVEAGYDAKLGAARFMPYVGIGPMLAIPTAVAAPVDITPLVYPGFSFRYENERSPLFAGADVRFLYMTETDRSSLALNLTTGVRF